MLAQADAVLARTSWATGHTLRGVLRWAAERRSPEPSYAGVEADLRRAVSLRPDLPFVYAHWNQLNPQLSAARRLDVVREYVALTAHDPNALRTPVLLLELAWAKRLVHDAAPSGALDAADCEQAEAELRRAMLEAPDGALGAVDRQRLEELRRLRATCREAHPGCPRSSRD